MEKIVKDCGLASCSVTTREIKSSSQQFYADLKIFKIDTGTQQVRELRLLK